MICLQKEHVSKINDYIPVDCAFICFASFESRCYTIAQNIDVGSVKKSFVFRNIDPPMNLYNVGNLETICKIMEEISVVEVSLNTPVSMADKMFSVIWEIVNSAITNVIVDISTFTHETLLILLKTMYIHRDSFSSINLIYNGASEYSEWLSKGCKDIRNVVGYPGFFNPSYKDHMIILTGFEKERATQLVELFEPDILSIGNGSEPTDENHLDTMCEMKKEFDAWFSNLGTSWEPFDFSCSNIQSTMEKISIEINKSDNKNIILVPLNTKLSTIAVALIALQNEKIQVVYPVPEVYNTIYSKPSENFTVIDLKEIVEFCK